MNWSTDRSCPTCDCGLDAGVSAQSPRSRSARQTATPASVERVRRPARGSRSTLEAHRRGLSADQLHRQRTRGSGVQHGNVDAQPAKRRGASYVHPLEFAGGMLPTTHGPPCPHDARRSSGFTINTATLCQRPAHPEAWRSRTPRATSTSERSSTTARSSTQQPSVNSLGALPGPGSKRARRRSRVRTRAARTAPRPARERSCTSGSAADLTHSYAKRALRVYRPPGQRAGPADRGRHTGRAATDRRLAEPRADRARANKQRKGRSSASAPAGPSRTIEVAYRAFSTDTSYAAVAKIAESVEAGVQLGVSPRQDRLGRHDHAQRARARAGPVPGRRRRAARPLPRALGAVPRPTHRLTRAVPGRLPIPGRNRAVPIPCGGVREPGRLPIRTRRKQGGRCHHEVSSADTSCPERWSS